MQVTVPPEWIDAVFPRVRRLLEKVQARNARMQSGTGQALLMVLEQTLIETTDKWAGRVSRSFALADLKAYLDVQAMLAKLTKTAGDKTTTWEELQFMWMKHGTMHCYLGCLPLPSGQSSHPEDKRSCIPCRNLLRHTGKLCLSTS